jgi:hypothetical protein
MKLSCSAGVEVYSTLAVDPRNGKFRNVFIPAHRIDRATELGGFAEIEIKRIVPRILACPRSILKGSFKLNDPESLGYVGQSEFTYTPEGDPISVSYAPESELWIVYVTGDLIVCDHSTTVRESLRSWLPLNWDRQFKEIVL